MVEAQKDTYLRVYANNGTYTYPQDPENILREKGKEYFENWEVTGSAHENCRGEKKYPLTFWVDRELMPALKDICVDLESRDNRRIWVRG